MKPIFRLAAVLFAAGLFSGISLHAQAPAAPRLVAIFVENRAGPELADKTAAFEDLLSARITTAGFSIIARDTALAALGPVTPGGPPTPADELLNNQTSALRLAQSLNANYVLVATLVSYGSDVRAFSGYGVNTLNRIYNLRATYRLCDVARGGSLIGDTVTATDTIAQTANASENNPDELNKLLDQAAASLADSFLQKVSSPQVTATPAPGLVPFSIECSMADLVLPDVLLDPNGQYSIKPLAYNVSPLDVTVELNGLALGSAPGNFTGPAGISKLRLTRQGFKTQELNVNLTSGFKLRVALQMDDAGYARWQQSIAYLQGLKTDAKITDADADRIRGIAQMFRQSGLRLDERSNIQITGNQTPVIQQVNQSLLSAPPAAVNVH